MVLVATQVKRRRGTTAENDAFTGAEGEITVDLTKKTLRVHDGSTQGGTELAKSSDIYTQAEIDDLLSGKSSTDLSNITADGKEVCANMGMPSSRYINLTLPVHGGYITMPADGYLVLEILSGISGLAIGLRNYTAGDVGMVANMDTGGTYIVHTHVSKGDYVQVYHYNSTPDIFRLVYANGSK